MSLYEAHTNLYVTLAVQGQKEISLTASTHAQPLKVPIFLLGPITILIIVDV